MFRCGIGKGVPWRSTGPFARVSDAKPGRAQRGCGGPTPGERGREEEVFRPRARNAPPPYLGAPDPVSACPSDSFECEDRPLG